MSDPYEETPEEQQLPEKPAIQDMPPEDGVEPPTDQEENEAEEPAPLDPSEAAADPTVDDEEDDPPVGPE